LNLKILFDINYKVLAVAHGESCQVADYLTSGEAETEANRVALLSILEHASDVGLHELPPGWFKIANRQEDIYEFKKGPLRLFFFKGRGEEIVVCTSVVRKSGQKADSKAINKAVAMRKAYFS
jgi:hypothetical protein